MPPSNWIPVSERLPESGSNIIVTDGKVIDVGNVCYYDSSVRLEEYRDTWVFDSWLENVELSGFANVTHWQPLPDPPEKESE